MAINNNIAMTNVPINTGKLSQVKKNENAAEINEVTPVVEKAIPNEFSLVLSAQQEESLNDTLGYDQPSGKERGALEKYFEVANQAKRDQIIESMSFHFVV